MSENNSPNVGFVREEVKALLPRWNLVRDCCAGQETVKAKGVDYLPKPNAADRSAENTARYDSYKQRAVFYNVTQRTLRGLVGQVLAKEAVAEVPAEAEPLLTDIDGAGVALDQQAAKALAHVLSYGRAGLLVDFPAVGDVPASKAEVASRGLRPTITLCDPWDVINWRTRTVGGQTVLALVVISESLVTDDDGYEARYDARWRVLRLDDAGLYSAEVWKLADNGDSDSPSYVLESRAEPTDGAGKRLDYIPFTFIGAANNDTAPDLPPLYDLAALNVAHYINSAELEELLFWIGQPTPVFAGLPEDWVENVLKGSVTLGSRGSIMLPVGGTASLLQVAPSSLIQEEMKRKEAQMVALGAKLVEQQNVQRTATDAMLANVSETSVLSTAARNVSESYTRALGWMLAFANVAGEVSYELTSDFSLLVLSAQDQAQLVAAWQANAITFEEMRGNLKRAGLAWEDDEEARGKAENNGLDALLGDKQPVS